MNRREFTLSLAAAALASRATFAQDPAASLSIDLAASGPAIPLDFTGLSYESAQLANPAFFSAANTALIDLFRGLGAQGVLRIGGGTSEFTTFTTTEPAGPPPFEVFGPDTSKTAKKGTLVTPAALRNLRAFLDATNWRALYGLNAGQGTAANAAEEAFYVHQILGPRLIAFQIGNEPDSWRNRYRPSTWTYPDYFKQWQAFHAAIVARVPAAKFAGPDVSNKLPYVAGFAADAHAYPDIVLLTSHYYAMGPAGSPKSTLEKLLDPNPKLAADLVTIMQAARSAHLPYRMSEGNSCWDGGKPGVSDTLASALWCADMMLQFAQAGAVGVNLHGGGNGFYTPIAGSISSGFTRRPEYFGMQFAGHFSGSTLLNTTFNSPSKRVTAYAALKDGRRQIAIINKDAAPIAVSMPHALPRHGHAECITLAGAALDQKETTLSGPAPAKKFDPGHFQVPAHSAIMLRV